MFLKNLSFTLILLVSSIFNISAQDKTFSAGDVINGKAVNLVRPPYPAAARAVRASGAVDVQVTIDEKGVVISARALSGHPLLRQAAEQAALASAFSTTTLQGQPVKVKGIIVYNFSAEMTWIHIGYELSFAEKSLNSPEYFPGTSIAVNISDDWQEEKTVLNKIDSFIRHQQMEKNNPKFETPTDAYTVQGDRSLSNNFDKNLDVVKALRDLEFKIENRLSPDAKRLWYFKLGEILGSLISEIDNSDKTKINIDGLSKLTENVPSTVAETAVTGAKDIIVVYRQSGITIDNKEKLLLLARSLRNLQVGK